MEPFSFVDLDEAVHHPLVFPLGFAHLHEKLSLNSIARVRELLGNDHRDLCPDQFGD
jgi:hypothetical protein